MSATAEALRPSLPSRAPLRRRTFSLLVTGLAVAAAGAGLAGWLAPGTTTDDTGFDLEAATTPSATRRVVSLGGSANGTVLTDLATGSDVAARYRGDQLVVPGTARDDTLIVDFTHGNPIPDGGLLFAGRNQLTKTGDLLVVEGGTFDKAVYDFANASDGTIDLDGSLITYRGLEPLAATGTVTDVIFTFTGGADQVVLEDDGTLGNDMSQLRSANATFETTVFTHPTGSLTVDGAPGDTLTVAALDPFGSIGVMLTDFDSMLLNTILGTADVVADVSTGAVTQVPGSITADTLLVDAATGINLPLIDVSAVEARTDTGGITLEDVNALTIGGISPGYDGLEVVTAGDVDAESAGTMTVADTDGLEAVKAGNDSGDVELDATGVTSDITTTTDGDAVTAPSGAIDLAAGRDIVLGNGLQFDNDVRASETVTMTAGEDVLVQGFSDVASDDFGDGTGGDLTVTGKTVTVSDANGDDASMGAGGNASADVDVTTAAGQPFLLTANFADAVFSSSGDVAVGSDVVQIASGSGITADDGHVQLVPVTPAAAIDLGSATDVAPNTLELSDAELDNLTADVVEIGSNATTGGVTFTSPVGPDATDTIVVRNGGAITESTVPETAVLTETNAALIAATGIAAADDLDLDVDTLAADNLTSNVNVINTGSLTIGTVDALSGLTNLAGNANVMATSPLTVSSPVSSGGDLTLTAGEIDDDPACADDLTISNGVSVSNSGIGTINLQAGDDLITGAGSSVQSLGALNLQPGFGDLDGCGDLSMSGSASGTTLDVDTLGDACLGALTNIAGPITVESTGGAITDCNDPPAGTLNVTATALQLEAATGIGKGAGGAIETDVDALEADTAAGGIGLSNAGPVGVGGVDATLDGLDSGGTGDVGLTATGTISLADTDGSEIVHANDGDILVEATGATSDVQVTVDKDAVTSSGGSAELSAGRDVLLGLAGPDYDNDVRADENILLEAGRDVTVDGFSDVNADDFGNATGGDATVTAGRDVNVTDTMGPDASVGAAGNGGGVARVTTGPGGMFRLTAVSNSALFSSSGSVTVEADRMEVAGDSGLSASSLATVVPVTAGRDVLLGPATDATAALELSDAEIDRIFSANLRIGNAATGDVTFTDAIAPANVTTMHVRTDDTVTSTNAGTPDVTVSNLALTSQDGASVLETAVATFAAHNASSGPIVVENTGGLTIGTVDGVTGVTNDGGLAQVVASSPMAVQQDVSASGNVLLAAHDSAGAGDDLTVPSGVDVESTGGDTTLDAGDILTVQPGAAALADGDLVLRTDSPSADAGGGTIALEGDADGASVQLFGGLQGDTLGMSGQSLSSPVSIDGISGTGDGATVANVDVDNAVGAGLSLVNLDDVTVTGSSFTNNDLYGINLFAVSDGIIGGPGPASNVITGNGESGIRMFSGSGVTFSRNDIRDNAGLGIDLVGDGITPNDAGDADTGPNNRQNFPELSIAKLVAGGVDITGALSGVPGRTYTIEVFGTTQCDPSGNGEAGRFVGSFQGTANGAGNLVFVEFFPGVIAGEVYTTTATDETTGDTSEFSTCIVGQPGGPDTSTALPRISVDDVSAAEGDGGTSVMTFTLTRVAQSLNQTSSVQFATSNGTATVAGDDYEASSGTVTFGPGEATKTVSVTINGDTTVEPDETFTLTLSSPTSATIGDGQAAGRIVNDDDPPEGADAIAEIEASAASIGQPLTYSATARNGGSAPAANVMLEVELPANALVKAVDAGCTTVAGTATCPAGELGSGDSKTFELVVVPVAKGSLEATATASTDSPDVDASNDEDSVTSTVASPACTLRGTPGDDVLRGTGGADVVCGLKGNDTIRGLRGDDVLFGGPGNDTMAGGRGFDVLYGRGGGDTLLATDATAANDFVHGGRGTDGCQSDAGDLRKGCP